jgi:hypothetical protein
MRGDFFSEKRMDSNFYDAETGTEVGAGVETTVAAADGAFVVAAVSDDEMLMSVPAAVAAAFAFAFFFFFFATDAETGAGAGVPFSAAVITGL